VQEGRNEIGEGIRGIKKKKCEGMNLVKASVSRFEVGVQRKRRRRSAGRNEGIWWRHPVELAVGV
jgi:hypothetical protein